MSGAWSSNTSVRKPQSERNSEGFCHSLISAISVTERSSSMGTIAFRLEFLGYIRKLFSMSWSPLGGRCQSHGRVCMDTMVWDGDHCVAIDDQVLDTTAYLREGKDCSLLLTCWDLYIEHITWAGFEIEAEEETPWCWSRTNRQSTSVFYPLSEAFFS